MSVDMLNLQKLVQLKGLLAFLAVVSTAGAAAPSLGTAEPVVRDLSWTEDTGREPFGEYLRQRCFSQVPRGRQGESERLEVVAVDRLSGLPRWLRLVVYDESNTATRMAEAEVDACFRRRDAVGEVGGSGSGDDPGEKKDHPTTIIVTSESDHPTTILESTTLTTTIVDSEVTTEAARLCSEDPARNLNVILAAIGGAVIGGVLSGVLWTRVFKKGKSSEGVDGVPLVTTTSTLGTRSTPPDRPSQESTRLSQGKPRA